VIDVSGHDHFRETHFYEDTRLSLNKLLPKLHEPKAIHM